MNDTELRNLDAWIIDTFGGRQNYVRNFGHTPPTMNDAVALAVLEKCARKMEVKIIESKTGGFYVNSDWEYAPVLAQTLPLAIALFARQIFSK